MSDFDMNGLLAQAMQMQQQLQEAQARAAEQIVEGVSGGGVVRIRVSGAGVFDNVSIDPAAVDPNDVSMLEDLVLAALHDASSKVRELSERAMGSLDLGSLGGALGGGLGGGFANPLDS
jgi:nucleoid-associated protein EbfC